MVPSKMDSPICGITMSVAGPLAAAAPEDGACGAAFVGPPFGIGDGSNSGLPITGAVAFAAGAEGVAATADPAASITPTTVFTWTVAPSWILISFSTPLAG